MSKSRIKVKTSEIRRVAQLQCTQVEAAAHFGIGKKTFAKLLKNPKARKAWDEGRETGKLSLRRSQFRMSKSNTQMAIHLGKHWLGQNDLSLVQHTGKDGGPIETVDLSGLSAKERKKLREAITRSQS